MSQLPNGNDLDRRSYVFSVDDASRIGEVRRFSHSLAQHVEFDSEQTAQVQIVINELGNNLLKYALDGRLILNTTQDFAGNRGLEILAVDKGPGVHNTQTILQDGFTTGRTPGTGLGAVKRQSDEFDIYSIPGKGTVVYSHFLNKKYTSNLNSFVWSGINTPYPGEKKSGDGSQIKTQNSHLFFMMVDGLGHGEMAHQASVEALDEFQKLSSQDLQVLMNSVHGRLKGTRGGAVFLISTQGDFIEFTGVGNIRAVLVDNLKTRTLISNNGTAGIQIRSVKPLREIWPQNAILILHSDGLQSRWDLKDYPGILDRHPSIVAAVLHRDFNRNNDDASVFVVRKSYG